MIHKWAGQKAPDSILVNVPRLVSDYYARTPDPDRAEERVSFGTSGHRGSASTRSFNEDHILATSQAICDYRRKEGISGPLFLAKDTHALSEPAHVTALEVLAANEVEVRIAPDGAFTPTPAVSRAILSHNAGNVDSPADGIVITPSHNPPSDGGFKYNAPHGGPAEAEITGWIQRRANGILEGGLKGVARVSLEKAMKAETTAEYDFREAYVKDLEKVVRVDVIGDSGLSIGVDPMGGAGLEYWDPIADKYGLEIEVVNRSLDPTFRFMTVDHDGKIRMDCSSPYAMAGLIELKGRFDIAFGNDTDFDRHGIVTPIGGLMNPNAYLAVAIDYLFRHRPEWSQKCAVGKTLVSSSMIDRVASDLGRELKEVPVGFKWFVGGLLSGEYGFGGEESAGASFLKMNGQVWTTDKDGIILDLLAAEMTAATEEDPSEHFQRLQERFGSPVYRRIDAPASAAQKETLKGLSPEQVTAGELAGEEILRKLTRAPGNDAPIGGLKVVTENAWFAARPSGTEDIYKIYAESFRGEEHLEQILEEAQSIVLTAFRQAGVGS